MADATPANDSPTEPLDRDGCVEVARRSGFGLADHGIAAALSAQSSARARPSAVCAAGRQAFQRTISSGVPLSCARFQRWNRSVSSIASRNSEYGFPSHSVVVSFRSAPTLSYGYGHLTSDDVSLCIASNTTVRKTPSHDDEELPSPSTSRRCTLPSPMDSRHAQYRVPIDTPSQ